MSQNTNFKLSIEQRKRRRFSDNFKKEKVQQIQSGQATVSEISKLYEVTTVNIYRWINKFGKGKKHERLVVENNSDTKQLLALQKRVAELERIVGQKQLLIDFKDKMIELAEAEYNVDIKKKFSTQPSNTSGKKGTCSK